MDWRKGCSGCTDHLVCLISTVCRQWTPRRHGVAGRKCLLLRQWRISKSCLICITYGRIHPTFPSLVKMKRWPRPNVHSLEICLYPVVQGNDASANVMRYLGTKLYPQHQYTALIHFKVLPLFVITEKSKYWMLLCDTVSSDKSTAVVELQRETQRRVSQRCRK